MPLTSVRSSSMADCRSARSPSKAGSVRVGSARTALGHAHVDHQCHEALLGTVVQIAFQQSAGVVGGRGDPPAGDLQVQGLIEQPGVQLGQGDRDHPGDGRREQAAQQHRQGRVAGDVRLVRSVVTDGNDGPGVGHRHGQHHLDGAPRGVVEEHDRGQQHGQRGEPDQARIKRGRPDRADRVGDHDQHHREQQPPRGAGGDQRTDQERGGDQRERQHPQGDR